MSQRGGDARQVRMLEPWRCRVVSAFVTVGRRCRHQRSYRPLFGPGRGLLARVDAGVADSRVVTLLTDLDRLTRLEVRQRIKQS